MNSPKKEPNPYDWSDLTWEPLNKENWGHFEDLFGSKGACGQCWCMNHRLPKKEFEKGKVDGINRQAMLTLAEQQANTGLLFFLNKETVGWMAFAPRQDFRRLESSRIHKPIDNREVWSLPCTFIAKAFRRKGLSLFMIKGAIEYASRKGVSTLEAYPVKPTAEKQPSVFLWVGIYQSFLKAGFEVVDDKSPKRPMMRYYIN